MASPSDIAAAVRAEAAERAPTLGATRLVCIDGPAGAGKTTVAAAFAEQEPTARVLHMDDLYDGWAGLPTVDRQLATLLEPLAAGLAGHYRRYDWYAAAPAEEVTVTPCRWLVLEGVGAGHRRFAELHTVLVWLTAPVPERHRRWVAREGSTYRWEGWRRDEEAHFATDGTEQRADLVFRT
ncbi:AAA family ATPase [Nocardioides panacisoli]|uniref:uridine kinase family protein n=1 Tax=Nocardioides panacisoli TaxID=627624 RepID=UPI001C624D95|nr:AAA family ATPase [Nocardioides panacisoli]QYJ05169.1 AAA family ATPase [Nocardioides panacisoli]